MRLRDAEWTEEKAPSGGEKQGRGGGADAEAPGQQSGCVPSPSPQRAAAKVTGFPAGVGGWC